MVLIMHIEACMRIHIQSINWKIWGMIEDGYTSPTIVVDGKEVPKSWSEWMLTEFSCTQNIVF